MDHVIYSYDSYNNNTNITIINQPRHNSSMFDHETSNIHNSASSGSFFSRSCSASPRKTDFYSRLNSMARSGYYSSSPKMKMMRKNRRLIHGDYSHDHEKRYNNWIAPFAGTTVSPRILQKHSPKPKLNRLQHLGRSQSNVNHSSNHWIRAPSDVQLKVRQPNSRQYVSHRLPNYKHKHAQQSDIIDKPKPKYSSDCDLKTKTKTNKHYRKFSANVNAKIMERHKNRAMVITKRHSIALTSTATKSVQNSNHFVIVNTKNNQLSIDKKVLSNSKQIYDQSTPISPLDLPQEYNGAYVLRVDTPAGCSTVNTDHRDTNEELQSVTASSIIDEDRFLDSDESDESDHREYSRVKFRNRYTERSQSRYVNVSFKLNVQTNNSPSCSLSSDEDEEYTEEEEDSDEVSRIASSKNDVMKGKPRRLTLKSQLRRENIAAAKRSTTKAKSNLNKLRKEEMRERTKKQRIKKDQYIQLVQHVQLMAESKLTQSRVEKERLLVEQEQRALQGELTKTRVEYHTGFSQMQEEKQRLDALVLNQDNALDKQLETLQEQEEQLIVQMKSLYAKKTASNQERRLNVNLPNSQFIMLYAKQNPRKCDEETKLQETVKMLEQQNQGLVNDLKKVRTELSKYTLQGSTASCSSPHMSLIPGAHALSPAPGRPKPKKKMRRLHWSKFKGKKLKESYFTKFKINDHDIKLDFARLEAMWCSPEKKTKNIQKKKKKKVKKPKAVIIRFLAQMGQKGIKELSVKSTMKEIVNLMKKKKTKMRKKEERCDAVSNSVAEILRDLILEMKCEYLQLNGVPNAAELVRKIKILLPENEEQVSKFHDWWADHKIKYSDARNFAECERLWFYCRGVPLVHIRMQLWLFKIEFEENLNKQYLSIELLLNTYKSIWNNPMLNKVLSVVLAIGNYINTGYRRTGDARAVNIVDVFASLSRCKANKTGEFAKPKQEYNLMMYLVETVNDRFPECKNWANIFHRCKECQRIRFDDLEKNVKDLCNAVQNVDVQLQKMKLMMPDIEKREKQLFRMPARRRPPNPNDDEAKDDLSATSDNWIEDAPPRDVYPGTMAAFYKSAVKSSEELLQDFERAKLQCEQLVHSFGEEFIDGKYRWEEFWKKLFGIKELWDKVSCELEMRQKATQKALLKREAKQKARAKKAARKKKLGDKLRRRPSTENLQRKGILKTEKLEEKTNARKKTYSRDGKRLLEIYAEAVKTQTVPVLERIEVDNKWHWLDRIASVLRAYPQLPRSLDIPGFLVDVYHVREKIKSDRDEDINYNACSVEDYLRTKHGFKCSLRDCECIKINTRNRLVFDKTGLEASQLMICSAHCVLLHTVDTGHALNTKELELMAAAQCKKKRGDNDDDCDSTTYLVEQASAELIARQNEYMEMRQDMIDSSDNNENTSKFVSTIDNSTQNEKQTASAVLAYSFGIKFYYWTYFKHRSKIDSAYNGGNYRYCDWYVARKYKSFKIELLQNEIKRILLNSWDTALKKAASWMRASIVKRMRSAHLFYCDILKGEEIMLFHLMALAFYTDFSKLSTEFSKVFRRIPANECDNALKRRNQNYREWGRLLTECVHAWGTRMYHLNCKTLFHGIKREMSFDSFCAVFCSPTSTTDSFPVAAKFAESGLILELKNNRSLWLTCFDCFTSDFGNEREYLLISGGIAINHILFSEIGLPFKSIQNIGRDSNYKVMVVAISALQQIVTGRGAFWNQIKSRPANVAQLQKLIEHCIRMNETNECLESVCEDNTVMVYIQKMFNSYCRSVRNIRVYIPVLNRETKYDSTNDRDDKKWRLFEVYRELLCELYPEETLEVNKRNWMIQKAQFRKTFKDRKHKIKFIHHQYHKLRFVNPIRGLKLDLFGSLFCKLVNIEIYQLPITHFVMAQVLRLFARNTNVERVLLAQNNGLCTMRNYAKYGYGLVQAVAHEQYPQSQNDFRSYTECLQQYEMEFKKHACKMKRVAVVDKLHHSVVGLECVLQSKNFYPDDYYRQTFNVRGNKNGGALRGNKDKMSNKLYRTQIDKCTYKNCYI